MTAPAVTRRPPVAWTRVTWVAWRQYRVALAGVAVLLAALGLYLLIMGLKIHQAYDAMLAGCHPVGTQYCQALRHAFEGYYGSTAGSVATSGLNAQTVPFLLLAVPGLIGVFAGAPVIARELETGTFRFAWTQGCGRRRWALSRLALLAAAVTGAAWAFSLLFSWYFQPFLAAGKTGPFPMQLFGTRGVAFAAWTLAAFAIAAFAGTVIRRTVPAMAAALAAWTVLDVTTMMALRQHYLAPLTGHGRNIPVTAWLLRVWFAPDGLPSYSYQPVSRFWSFQLIEGGWLLAFALVLLAGTVWLVRRSK
jgi:ABC-2 family transporter protein